MDKGIRPACNAKFAELLPQRNEIGNTAFRKAVMAYICEEYSISVASAATHYNHSFKAMKVSNPELVEGLGRAEDKKGGRKPKVAAVVGAPEEAVQTEFTVKKKSDSSIVAEGLTFEAARELVNKAAAQKKAKLYWV